MHALRTKRSYAHFIISNIFSLSISLWVKKGKKICVWYFFIYVFKFEWRVYKLVEKVRNGCRIDSYEWNWPWYSNINTTQPRKMSFSNLILKWFNLRAELSFKSLGNVEWWLIILHYTVVMFIKATCLRVRTCFSFERSEENHECSRKWHAILIPVEFWSPFSILEDSALHRRFISLSVFEDVQTIKHGPIFTFLC